MEVRGVRVKKITRHKKDSGFFVIKPPEYFSVPLLADDGDRPVRAVNVGEKVKEGSLIAKPVGKYGSYVYSPCSGKVVSVIKKMNASGNECEHVIILRDLDDEKEYLSPYSVADYNQELLLKRLYESGMIDNFAPFDPAYKKYLLKRNINNLLINCTEDDPYQTNESALVETYTSEVVEGARLLAQVAKSEKITFMFTYKQKALAKLIKKQIKVLNIQKLIKIKYYQNVYPLHNSRLIAYYETGKMVSELSRTAEVGVIVDTPSNCYDFYNAVTKGMPAIQKAVTVSGNNCLRKANYFIKNGTPLNHILSVVGTKDKYENNMLIYGGIMSGIAQETLDISVTLTASCILFCDSNEYSRDAETACINCGRCVSCCPVRLHVKNLDEAIVNRDFVAAHKLGIKACINCGACSFVCPAKRYLSQRISFAKDYVSGKRSKKPNDSEYVLVAGEDMRNAPIKKFDRITQTAEKFNDLELSKNDISEVEQMLKFLEDQKNTVGGQDNE